MERRSALDRLAMERIGERIGQASQDHDSVGEMCLSSIREGGAPFRGSALDRQAMERIGERIGQASQDHDSVGEMCLSLIREGGAPFRVLLTLRRGGSVRATWLLKS